jgi:serine/threonine-protein kinase
LAFELQHTASGIGGTGTPGYMAPEQERGAACAPATDRFALALVAYELLTGRALQPPASGERELRPASGVYLEHVRGHGQRPKFESVFTRALHLNPHARFDSARAFVEALAALASPQSSDTEGVPLCAGC